MVGGPTAFVNGHYAGTPLANVLPVELDGSGGATAEDATPFVPRWTDQGRAAPLLQPLRGVVGDDLPQMAGTNVLGDVRPGGVALWTHPTRTTRRGAPMPVLAIGDEGDGRSIALGIDGLWMLKFSQLGARTAGRGHGALWDGLLGWLMRDPRFEPAQIEIVGGCTAGLASTLRAQVLPAAAGAADAPVAIDRAQSDRSGGASPRAPRGEAPHPRTDTTLDFALPPLAAGGYTARLHVGKAGRPPDAISPAKKAATSGQTRAPMRIASPRSPRRQGARSSPFAGDAGTVPFPRPTVVSAERHVVPLAAAVGVDTVRRPRARHALGREAP